MWDGLTLQKENLWNDLPSSPGIKLKEQMVQSEESHSHRGELKNELLTDDANLLFSTYIHTRLKVTALVEVE